MKLETAISFLKDDLAREVFYDTPSLRGAIKLGIEALRDKKAERIILGGLSKQLLPGETKELVEWVEEAKCEERERIIKILKVEANKVGKSGIWLAIKVLQSCPYFEYQAKDELPSSDSPDYNRR